MNTCPFPLSALPPGKSAEVTHLCKDPAMRRRLLDLGMVKGTTVTCLQRSPAGDPTAYLIRGTVIALRSEDAEEILMCGEVNTPWA